jgi:hypothetical protein
MLLTFIGKVEAAPISQNYFTVTLPATALLKTIQPLLPLEFTHSHSSLQGKLQIDSIDNITISKRGISLSGIISGKDMSVNTTIGGQDLNLKMGKLTMPASCDLHLRFDQRKKHLFVTPHFRQAQDTENTGNGGSNDLLNMLSDIVGKEYLLDTNQFLSFKPVINGQNRSIHLEPVDIWTKDDRLIIKLQPVEKNQTQ